MIATKRTDTPRTDVVCPTLNLSHTDTRYAAEKLRNFARQLERELAAEKEKVQELVAELGALNSEFKRLPHSLGYKYTHTGKVDLIVAKHKETK